MLSRVDSEGMEFQLLKEIYDHRSDWREITKRFGFTLSKNFNKNPKRKTVGLKLQVEWKYGTMQWLDINDLKSSNPLDLSEYAVTNKIS